MMFGLCHLGNWGSIGNFGAWGLIGLILNLLIGFGVIASLILLVFLAARRARVPADVPSGARQPVAASQQTPKEI